MFNLITANDAAVLAEELGERLRARMQEHLLIPALVLVPQAGLRRWLQVYLAEKLGVVANLAFRAPAEFAWDLLRAARPDLPRRSPFQPDVLRWHIYMLLGESLDGAALTPLCDYLAGEGDPLRRYAFSGELAHVYERLQGYRRERLLQWERGGDANDWQAELWRRLVHRVGDASRAARVNEWLRRYDKPDAQGDPPPGLPAHVHAFACANISPDVLRMLGVAARYCELDFHLPLPTREYLGDTPDTRREVRERLLEDSSEDDGQNRLILSLGRAAKEFFNLLYDYGHVQPGREIDRFDETIERKTLLSRVRDDILAHRTGDPADRIALPDDSIQFHACHSPLREVQTLHDRLLAMLDADPALKPRDIAVMMPVAAYRPAIQAVFGGLPARDARFIPFNVGDVPLSAVHPAAQLFLRLLDASASRWETAEILDVLAVPGVMRRFDLDTDALEQLSRQVREAGVCWGEDESARAQVGGYREFSWKFGLDRVLAGFALGDDEDALAGGIAPLAGVEGAAFARLDALLAVLAAWRRLRELSSRKLSAAEWQRTLNAIFDGLYTADADDLTESRALALVRAALERLAEDTAAARVDQPLAWRDACAFLRERLNEADLRQQLFSGGVAFYGMVPLRVVPFRVICLLGMDEAAFPRREISALDPLLADRRAGHPLKGDRNVRDDDRLLFLQLIAAARDTLYLSWIGRDARSNKELPPSVVIAELIDELKRGYLLPPADDEASNRRDALLPRVQPLHPFDPSLFGIDGKPPRSYRGEWLATASAPAQRTGALAAFMHGELPMPETGALMLDELQRFFADPARGFLKQALAMHWPRDDHEDVDAEPLSPNDGLLRYALTSRLLRMPTHDDAEFLREKQRLRAQGLLPPGHYADAAIELARESDEGLYALVRRFTAGAESLPAVTRTLELPDGTLLTGTFEGLYPNGLLRADGGKLHGRRVLRAWLDALFATACGVADRTRLIGFVEGDKPCALPMPRMDAAEAIRKLAAFVALYHQGLRAPLPLFPRTSWECLKRLRKSGPADFNEFIAQFAQAIAGEKNSFGGPSEWNDSAIRTVWRGVELPGVSTGALAKDLYRIACEVFPAVTPVTEGVDA